MFGEEDSNNGKSNAASTSPQVPACPECTSQKIVKDGMRRTKNGDVQRFLCKSCCFRFSETRLQLMKKLDVRKQRRLEPLEPGSDLAETSVRDFDFAVKKILDDPALSIGENMSPHVSSDVTVTGKRLNILCSNSCNTEYCASEREAKNLVETESRTEKRAAGNILAKRGANLKDPESIKEKIAQQEWSQGRKANAVDAYTRFLMMLEMEWSPPRYKRIRKLPFIPTESEVDQLIAGCSFRTGTFLHLLKLVVQSQYFHSLHLHIVLSYYL